MRSIGPGGGISGEILLRLGVLIRELPSLLLAGQCTATRRAVPPRHIGYARGCCREIGNPRYILDLIKCIVPVSVETMRIVTQLPPLEILD